MKDAHIAGLPVSDTPAQVLGSMQFVFMQLGHELGLRYDTFMIPLHGSGWLKQLEQQRAKRLNIFDPQFVLSEPLYNPGSPLRQCLPKGGAFYNILEESLRVRNKWYHHDVIPNLTELVTSIEPIHKLATSAELQLGGVCAAIKKRAAAILSGEFAPEDKLAAPDPDMVALTAELTQTQARREALEVELKAAERLLAEAAGHGERQAMRYQGALTKLQAVEAELEKARHERERLEFLIEGLAAQSDKESSHLVAATPGHPWPGAIPGRRVVMMSLANDLYDEASGRRLSDEYGSEIQAKVKEWRAGVPAGVSLYVTQAGQACTYIQGQLIYLGSLRETPDAAVDSAVQGFFVPHTYTLRLGGDIECQDSGHRLSDVNPSATTRVVKSLLEHMPQGGRLMVTTQGNVAARIDGQWTYVGQVSREEWFPGHLAGHG